jgi:hypothetical protein
MLQVALLAALTNLAIAVVSAQQDPVVFNTSSPLFGSLTNCGPDGPESCGDGDGSQEDLCCYEYPGVSYIRYHYYRYLGVQPQTDARLRGCYCKHRYARGERVVFPSEND